MSRTSRVKAKVRDLRKREQSLVGPGAPASPPMDSASIRRLTIEHCIGQLLLEADRFSAVAPAVLQTICELENWTCGIHWEIDTETKALRRANTWAAPNADVGAFFTASLELSLTQLADDTLVRAHTLRKPIWIADVGKEPGFLRADSAQRAGLRRLLAFPILAHKRAIGVLEFYGQDARSADSDSLAIAVSLGHLLGRYCERRKDEERLRRFRAAFDASGDAVYVIDYETLRYVDCNQTAIDRTRYTREEILTLGPADFLITSPEQVKRDYDDVIAKYPESVRYERMVRNRSGDKTIVELHLRALRHDNKWYVVTVSRTAHERKQAEKAMLRISRMYTALSATNEAMLRATSQQDLYQQVCDAAVLGGLFVTAAVLTPDITLQSAVPTAASGQASERIQRARLSIDPALPEGQGLIGTAFRTRTPTISNELVTDERARPWRDAIHKFGWVSGAAIPLIRRNEVTGLLVFLSTSRKAFDAEVVTLLERMAQNVVFALDNLDRETERRLAEAARRRFTALYRSLSATNEAIIRARSPEEIYQSACDAALTSGEFVAASIFVVDPAGASATVVANAGPWADKRRGATVPLGTSASDSSSMLGVVYHSGEACVSNNYQSDDRFRNWHAIARQTGTRAVAALPIRCDGAVHAVLSFYSGERDAFDEEAIALLKRIAENISFALENIQRETKRLEAESALRSGEEKYRAVLENMSDGYWETDLDGNYTAFNETICSSLGYTRDELLGMSYRNVYDEHYAKIAHEAFMKAHRTRQPVRGTEWKYIRKDGLTGTFDLSIQLVVDENGNPTGFRGVTIDTTERTQAQEALRESEEKHRSILENMGDGYWETDLHGNFVHFNESLRKYMGYEREEMIGLHYTNYYDEETAKLVHDTFTHMYQTGQPVSMLECGFVRKDGTRGTFESTVELIRDKHGNAVGFRGISRYTTERKKAEAALRASESRFRALTELSSDWYWETDSNYCFTRFEGRLVNDYPDLFERYRGKAAWEVLHADGNGADLRQVLTDGHKRYRDFTTWRETRDGQRLYFSTSGEPMFGPDGEFLGYRGISRNVTKQKLAEQRIQYLASHDALTELPNRMMFSQLLSMALDAARRHERKIAVLFIDLDRFKVINDTLGHEAGDMLLKEVAGRLKQTLRSGDVVARLGGDEFVVMLSDISDVNQVAAIARKILFVLSASIRISDQDYRVTASIGISLFPSDAEDEPSLMKNADMAMYLAKEEGKNNFQFYSQSIQKRSIERLSLETNLRRAIEHEEFSLHYQAKLDLASGKITGVEALLRWQSAALGSVSPAQFIPLAEETGLIVPIGQWVLRTACAQSMAWQRAGLPTVCMAVNLSARQFADENLLDDIDAVLKDTGLKPQLLELEITEGMVMQNPERAAKVLNGIKEMGVRLAMDDFGTGYSSLAQIKRFPLDTLKVDRSFIRDLPQDAEDKAITEAIIAMAKTLDLTVVAEGVETREQAEFLRGLACDEVQGYYFSRPIPPDNFATLLQQHSLPPH